MIVVGNYNTQSIIMFKVKLYLTGIKIIIFLNIVLKCIIDI